MPMGSSDPRSLTDGECTLAAAFEHISNRTLPFFWDDAGDFQVLEKLAVAAFNKSQKKTATKKRNGFPRTVPLITMNPQSLKKTVKTDKEKLVRVFSRIAVLPFKRVEKNSIENSLNLQTELRPLMDQVVKSVGVILELSSDFTSMKTDALFKDILQMNQLFEGLDIRTQFNYVMLMYSTGKILEKIGMKEEYFPLVVKCMRDVVIPNHKQLMQLGDGTSEKETTLASIKNVQNEEMLKVINDIVIIASENPEKVKSVFKPKVSSRKCSCGDAFAFNVAKMLEMVQKSSEVDALRTYVKKQGIGCNGIKININNNQCNGTHIKRSFLKSEVIEKLDQAWNKRDSNKSTDETDDPCMPSLSPANSAITDETDDPCMPSLPPANSAITGDEITPNVPKRTKRKRNESDVLKDALFSTDLPSKRRRNAKQLK